MMPAHAAAGSGSTLAAMGTEKRQRQKAARKARLEAAREAQVKARRRQRLYTYGGIAAVLVVTIVGIAALLRDDNDSGSGEDEIAAPGEGEVNGTEPPPPGDGEPADCPAEDGSSEQRTEFPAPQQMCIDPAKTYVANVSTTAGDFTMELDASIAPNTVNNFVVLARYHYYDDVAFHRIIPDFVVQGGDPVGEPPGTGGPGYQFADELPTEPSEAGNYYASGSVAMANSGPNTNGSQFFVVTGASGEALPPQYSLFGTVTDGMDVVLELEAAGTPSGEPSEDVRINTVTITEAS